MAKTATATQKELEEAFSWTRHELQQTADLLSRFSPAQDGKGIIVDTEKQQDLIHKLHQLRAWLRALQKEIGGPQQH